jgi:predicted metal-dependent peptidase
LNSTIVMATFRIQKSELRQRAESVSSISDVTLQLAPTVIIGEWM